MNIKRNSILLVDDEVSIRITFGDYLKALGYTVYLAENGKIGIELFEKYNEDIFLVISDLKMGDWDGMWFIEKVRKINTEIPIVILTAYASLDNALEALRKGAFDYLTKPINLQEVEILIEKAHIHLKLKKEEKENIELKGIMETVVTTNHQINQPLTVILCNTEFLMEKLSKFENEKKYIQTIMNEAKKIRDILKKLTKIEKIDRTEYIDGITMLNIDK